MNRVGRRKKAERQWLILLPQAPQPHFRNAYGVDGLPGVWLKTSQLLKLLLPSRYAPSIYTKVKRRSHDHIDRPAAFDSCQVDDHAFFFVLFCKEYIIS